MMLLLPVAILDRVVNHADQDEVFLGQDIAAVNLPAPFAPAQPIDAREDCPLRDGLAPVADAACVEGGLPPGVGSPFACGTETCFTQSEYCFFEAAGQTRDPGPGGAFSGGTCAPFPCSCGATPSCECLRSIYKAPCRCVEVCGATGVFCVYP